MIARITNFASKENQIIEWDERIPKIRYDWDDYQEHQFKLFLNQFYLLLEKYPDSLKDDVILRKYQELKKYAKDNKTAINNLYSYYNKVKLEDVLRGDPKTNIYGVRVLPIDCYPNYNCITITGYNSTAGGILLSKEELKLKLNKEGIGCISMMEMDSTFTNIIVGEKKMIKHLQK